MGFAIASAAANRGADVRLVSGPVSLETPRNVLREDVSTADEMYEAVKKNLDWYDVLIMTAAVSDYKIMDPSDRKMKREDFAGHNVGLALVENVDILKSLSEKKGRKIFVGFALETDNDLENATKKLQSKCLDMIVMNNPRDKGAGFGTEANKVTLVFSSGEKRELSLMPKYEVALRILDGVIELIDRKITN